MAPVDIRQYAGMRVVLGPEQTCVAIISEAAGELYLNALIEIGLVLFIITLIVNSLSRLLIWSMAKNSAGPRVASVAVVEETA